MNVIELQVSHERILEYYLHSNFNLSSITASD